MNPRNLGILYEDNHIIVCQKPPQVATESGKVNSPDMVSMLKNYLFQASSAPQIPYLAVIHRLDQPVNGILVFAKTPFAAKELSHQLTSAQFGKYYRALVNGMPEQTAGTIENYLTKDARNNISRICGKNTPGAKFARLHYQVVKKGQGIFNLGRSISNFTPSPTELDIHLETGRHHQIRVQLAGIGCPIVGDTKYNPHSSAHRKGQNICLCAYKLEFHHPKTGKPMCFRITQEGTGLL